MKIAINTLAVTPDRSGAKTYPVNLVRNIADIDNTNTYFLILNKMNEHMFPINKSNFHRVVFPLTSDNKLLRILLEQILIPIYIKKYKIDVLFSPGNITTIFSGCKKIVTINDIGYKEIPGLLSKQRIFYYSTFLPVSVKKSDFIITISKSIRNKISHEFKTINKNIKVIYHGIDLSGFSDRESRRINDLEGSEKFIFFLSTLHKHKNPDKLIESFAILKSKYNIPHKLVIAGRDPGNRIKELSRLCESLAIKKEVIFTGRLDFKGILWCYQNADVFVFPSSHEGFGLPVLEAMACGTPVVASNRMSVPEVAGDAALIVDPDNIEEMAEAIYRVIRDEKLRESLIRKGYERVREFSWEKTARETIKVFEEVADE